MKEAMNPYLDEMLLFIMEQNDVLSDVQQVLGIRGYHMYFGKENIQCAQCVCKHYEELSMCLSYNETCSPWTKKKRQKR